MLKTLEKYPVMPFILFIITAGVIFYFSSIPHDPVPSIGFPYKAVIYHIGIFFLLCLFLMIALARGKSTDWMFFAILFSIMYGFSDELHQYFVPGRASSLVDIFYNLIGIGFAGMVYFIFILLRNEKDKNIKAIPSVIRL